MRLNIIIFLCGLLVNMQAKYPPYKEISAQQQEFIRNLPITGGYLDEIYTSNTKKADVHSILELGSRDCIDALRLSEYYKCHVFAFECNPEAINACKKNIQDNPNVTLIPFAVWNKADVISFFPMVETQGIFYNPGASSCFPVSRDGHHKTYVQKEITVPAIRLDVWLQSQGIDSIDMLCMDVQGAALQVLEGMGSYLDHVKYIITELEHTKIYLGEALFAEVEQFLAAQGFKMYLGRVNSFFGDYLFVRKDIIRSWWGPDFGV